MAEPGCNVGCTADDAGVCRGPPGCDGCPSVTPDAVGLRYYTIDLPNQQAYEEVVARVDAAGVPTNQTEAGLLLYDPSQNGVILRVIK